MNKLSVPRYHFGYDKLNRLLKADFKQKNNGGSWSNAEVDFSMKIGCNCETGTRVCESTTNNGGGSYTLQYHYQFSDNTNSATVTETITCSGVNKKLINCNCETAVKIYTGSTECGKSSDNGCCPGKWLCTFRYHWSDGSNYYGSECSDTPCTPE